MVRLKQTAEYIGGEGLHQWRCRVELDCPPAELALIQRVVYTLDRSFPDPVRKVSDRGTGFALEFLTWASFELFAAVEYGDASHELLHRELVLPLPDEEAGGYDPEDVPEDCTSPFTPPVLLTDEADVVLDGGGVRCIAFAGAIEAAEAAGIERWVHIAGSSGGALVAALLAAGCRPSEISGALLEADGDKLLPWAVGGAPGRWARAWSNQGQVSTKRLQQWLEARFAASPLANPRPTFGDLIRADASARTRHPLKIIVSDVTAARMVVLPDALNDYQDASGQPIVPEAFPLIDAVIMSMSVPYWFAPSILYRNGAPHQMLDGGLLSNFPIWLFDVAFPTRPTWGVRLSTRRATDSDTPGKPATGLAFARALVMAVMGAAREFEPSRNESRTLTVPVPSGVVGPQLSRQELETLQKCGNKSGREFFASRGAYLNSLGGGLAEGTLIKGPLVP